MTSSPLTINDKAKRDDKVVLIYPLVNYNKMLFDAYATGDHGAVKHLFENFKISDYGAFSIEHDGEDNSETRTA